MMKKIYHNLHAYLFSMWNKKPRINLNQVFLFLFKNLACSLGTTFVLWGCLCLLLISASFFSVPKSLFLIITAVLFLQGIILLRSRFPLSLRTSGYWIFQLGFAYIVIALFASHYMAYEGRVALRPGETVKEVLLDEKELKVQVNSEEQTFLLNSKLNKVENLRLNSGEKLKVKIKKIVPNAVLEKNVAVGVDDGDSGILLHLFSAEGEFNDWVSFGGMVDKVFSSDFAKIYLLTAQTKDELTYFLRDRKDELFQNHSNALWIVFSPEGNLFYRLMVDGVFTQSGPIFLEKEYRTGWKDVKFSIDDVNDNIRVKENYVTRNEFVPFGQKIEEALLLEFTQGKTRQNVWVQLNRVKNLSVFGQKIKLEYFHRKKDLPFEIGATLEKQSEVLFPIIQLSQTDAGKKSLFQLPFWHRGFHLSLIPSENNELFLSVKKDPLLYVKLVGGFCILLGVFLQVYFLPYWESRDLKKRRTTSFVLRSNSSTQTEIQIEKKEEFLL